VTTGASREWAKAVAAKGQRITSDRDARMLAWSNGMRAAKAAGAFGPPESYEEQGDRAIAYARLRYMRDEIDIDEFERAVERALLTATPYTRITDAANS
jgi:hypothetical protein